MDGHIPNRQKLINELIREHFPNKHREASANGHHVQSSPLLPDEEVERVLRDAKNSQKFEDLFDKGDVHQHHDGDDSGADQGLVNMIAFVTQDPEQIDRFFRRSALMRPKWDEVHRGDGATYGDMTIEKATDPEYLKATYQQHDGTSIHLGNRDGGAGEQSAISQPKGLQGRIKLGERITKGVEEPEQIVKGIIYRARTHAVNSDPGEGKTLFALWVCLEAIKQGLTVLYLDAENGPALIAERLEAMGVNPNDLDKHFHYYPHPDLTLDKDSIADLIETTRAINPDLVVCDSLPDFLAIAGLNENDAGDITRWMTTVIQPLKDADAAILLLDHLTKSTEGRGRYARGSSAKLAKVDVSWSLTKTVPFDRDNIGEIEIRVRKDRLAYLPTRQRFAVGGTPLMFRRSDGLIEEPGANNLTKSAQKALDVLSTHYRDTGATYTEWRRSADLVDSTLSRAIQALIKNSLVEQRGNRYYLQPQVELSPHFSQNGSKSTFTSTTSIGKECTQNSCKNELSSLSWAQNESNESGEGLSLLPPL